jgi:hypothetical protein
LSERTSADGALSKYDSELATLDNTVLNTVLVTDSIFQSIKSGDFTNEDNEEVR